MATEKMERFEALMPQGRAYELIRFYGELDTLDSKFNVTIRMDLSSAEDVKLFVAEFSEAFSCNFIHLSSKKQKKHFYIVFTNAASVT